MAVAKSEIKTSEKPTSCPIMAASSDEAKSQNPTEHLSCGGGIGGDGGGGGGGDGDEECPGCDTGCEGSAHIDPNTNDFYKNCLLNMNTCIWCGRASGQWDYCSSNCANAEKRHDDAMGDMFSF
jgi:hypothetical protein